MPKLSGIFDQFKDLDQIPLEDIAKWLKSSIPTLYLENYFANRLYYSQAAPVSLEDLNIDLAILREALKKNPYFYISQENKLIIPDFFVSRIPNLNLLILAYIDAYLPRDVATVVLKNDTKEEVTGSVLTPLFKEKRGLVNVSIEGKEYTVKQGAVELIPCSQKRCHVNFKSDDAQVLGKNEAVLEAFGGKLGVLVDGRRSM